jgi:hypothetical protein
MSTWLKAKGVFWLNWPVNCCKIIIQGKPGRLLRFAHNDGLCQLMAPPGGLGGKKDGGKDTI